MQRITAPEVAAPYAFPPAVGRQLRKGGNETCNITHQGCQRCLGSNPSSTTYWLHVSAGDLTSLCLSFLLQKKGHPGHADPRELPEDARINTKHVSLEDTPGLSTRKAPVSLLLLLLLWSSLSLAQWAEGQPSSAPHLWFPPCSPHLPALSHPWTVRRAPAGVPT